MAADNQAFRHYSVKHRVISWLSQHLFDNLTYTVRHGLNTGMKRRGGLGWLPEFLANDTETAEQTFWRKLDLQDKVVYDVGAFHGLLTLFFARHARTVVSYEPNTCNHARLIQNVRLNRLENVIVRKLGVGCEFRRAVMVMDPPTPGGASIERNIVGSKGGSNGPIVHEEIPVVRLDDDIRDASLPAPDVIKIDVEGLELAALTGARQTILTHCPRLFIEIHGETMSLKRQNARDVVICLEEMGYRNIRHVESGRQVDRATAADVAAQGHLDCVASSAPLGQ